MSCARDTRRVTRDAGPFSNTLLFAGTERDRRHLKNLRRVNRVSLLASRIASSGISLIAALFLIVVIAALGAFAVKIGGSQQQTVNLALLSARALAAADSGVEWAGYQAFHGGCASTTTTTLNLTEAVLNGFTVVVVCTPTTHTESNAPVHVYSIDSTATLGTYGMPDFVSRHVYATFTDAQ